MKQSEVLDYAMRGLIVLMSQEQDEKKLKEMDQALKKLATMFVEAERAEVEQLNAGSRLSVHFNWVRGVMIPPARKTAYRASWTP